MNSNYGDKFRELQLSKNVMELFNIISVDTNLKTQKLTLLAEKQRLKRQVGKEKLALSKARRLFIENLLKIDDYNEFKKEHLINLQYIGNEIIDNVNKLKDVEMQYQKGYNPSVDIFTIYSSLDKVDKRHLVSIFPPKNVNYQTGEVSLELKSPIAKILLFNGTHFQSYGTTR